jgi:hypothetical protein
MLSPEGAGSLLFSFISSLSNEPAGPSEVPPITPLLHVLASPPSPSSALDRSSVTSTHLAALLFSHLIRSSPQAKAVSRSVIPSPIHPTAEQGSGKFFVPADGPPPEVPPVATVDDDEPPQTLLQLLCENLSLSFLSRSRANTSDWEAREWDRLVVGYLCLLSQWLWEDPSAVKEFLDAGGLGVVSCLTIFVFLS